MITVSFIISTITIVIIMIIVTITVTIIASIASIMSCGKRIGASRVV